MSSILVKGQKITLERDEKAVKPLNEISIGIAWAAQDSSKTFDIDASALLLNGDGKIAAKEDLVYYNAKKHPSGALWSMRDFVGERSAAEELLIARLQALPERYQRIGFFATIYQAKERRQHFGLLKNLFIHILDKETNKELLKYPLLDGYAQSKALYFGELYRKSGNDQTVWKFNAIGNGLSTGSITEIVDTFR
ncbi:TerD family protein [Breznakiellaceae bacterium SP9]